MNQLILAVQEFTDTPDTYPQKPETNTIGKFGSDVHPYDTMILRSNYPNDSTVCSPYIHINIIRFAVDSYNTILITDILDPYIHMNTYVTYNIIYIYVMYHAVRR